jgi:hypothetical protein
MLSNGSVLIVTKYIEFNKRNNKKDIKNPYLDGISPYKVSANSLVSSLKQTAR